MQRTMKVEIWVTADTQMTAEELNDRLTSHVDVMARSIARAVGVSREHLSAKNGVLTAGEREVWAGERGVRPSGGRHG